MVLHSSPPRFKGAHEHCRDAHPHQERLRQQRAQRQQEEEAYARTMGLDGPRAKHGYPKLFSRNKDFHDDAPPAHIQYQCFASSAPPRAVPDADRARRVPGRVAFSHLQIRTHETILGDNPSCSGGPSLGLGWRYDPSHCTVTVDAHEARRERLPGARRLEDLVLYRWEREVILLKAGYTRGDLAESVRAGNRVKGRRRRTVHNLPVAVAEEGVETVRRTLRRWGRRSGRTRRMYDEWKEREEGMKGGPQARR